MRLIKIVLSISIVFFTVSSCKAKPESESVKKIYTVTVSKDAFLKNVVDFVGNPGEWKYLGDKPAIIDFYADWCIYCRKLAPVLEELAKEYDGKLVIYKVNTDKEKDIAAAFGIRALPTLLFIPLNGNPEVAQGAVPKEDLKKYIENFLLKD